MTDILKKSQYLLVYDVLINIDGMIDLLVASEPLDVVGNDIERKTFLNFKHSLVSYRNKHQNMYELLDIYMNSLSELLSKPYQEVVAYNMVQAWDKTIQVLTIVLPPFHEIFLGPIPHQVNDMPPGWLYVIPHYIQAVYNEQNSTLEDVLKSCLDKAKNDYDNDVECNFNMSNAIIIQRSPEIIAISVESESDDLSRLKGIEFPEHIDLSLYRMTSRLPTSQWSNRSSESHSDDDDDDDDDDEDDEELDSILQSSTYDLVSVITTDSVTKTEFTGNFRVLEEIEDDLLENNATLMSALNDNSIPYIEKWMRKGSDLKYQEITSKEAIAGSYYSSQNKSATPRFLVYAKRGLHNLFDRLLPFVSKAGQSRAMGDMTYALATTIESYKEARRYYEDAIHFDPSYRETLQDTLQALDKIDNIQHSRSLEEQGDISLVNHRLKEAFEFYSQASASLSSSYAPSSSNNSNSNTSSSSSSLVAVSLSGLTQHYDERLKEKLSLVKSMSSLEIVVHCVEKGEEALREGKYPNSKDFYSKALKLNQNPLFQTHFQTISSYIDKTMQTLVAIQKIDDAHVAMKEGKYRLANQLFSEAIILVPDKASGLQNILDGFTPLIQCEDALIKQRDGNAAFEEKNYPEAIKLLTEAMDLLPPERVTDMAIFFSDRASVYHDIGDHNSAIEDCDRALALKTDYAMAYFRKGMSLFALNQYQESIQSYDKAEGFDPSLSAQVKVKIRQVNTAREIFQRKEREAERLRAKEEEKALFEQLKRDRDLKMALEQAQKKERLLMKTEERLSMLLRTITVASTPTVAENSSSSSSKKVKAIVCSQDESVESQEQGDCKKDDHQKNVEKQKMKEEKAALRQKQREDKEREKERQKAEKEAALSRHAAEMKAALEKKLQQEREALEKQQEKERLREQERIRREEKKKIMEQKRILKQQQEQLIQDQAAKLIADPVFAPISLPIPVAPITPPRESFNAIYDNTNMMNFGIPLPTPLGDSLSTLPLGDPLPGLTNSTLNLGLGMGFEFNSDADNFFSTIQPVNPAATSRLDKFYPQMSEPELSMLDSSLLSCLSGPNLAATDFSLPLPPMSANAGFSSELSNTIVNSIDSGIFSDLNATAPQWTSTSLMGDLNPNPLLRTNSSSRLNTTFNDIFPESMSLNASFTDLMSSGTAIPASQQSTKLSADEFPPLPSLSKPSLKSSNTGNITTTPLSEMSGLFGSFSRQTSIDSSSTFDYLNSNI